MVFKYFDQPVGRDLISPTQANDQYIFMILNMEDLDRVIQTPSDNSKEFKGICRGENFRS